MMKNLAKLLILTLLLIGSPFIIYADLPGQAPSTINKPNQNPFPKQAPPKEKPLPQHKIPLPPQMGSKEVLIPFTLPGIVGINQGQWAGSDNLYNLSPNISIYVELVTPEDTKFEVSDREIKDKIQEIFSKAGITPYALHEPWDPSLPLFHVLVMLNSVDQCYSGFCACRLFEPVSLKRMVVEQGTTFQAITWEKQDLIAATKKDFYQLLDKTINNLSDAFVERYQYFQNIKVQRQGR